MRVLSVEDMCGVTLRWLSRVTPRFLAVRKEDTTKSSISSERLIIGEDLAGM